MNEPSINITEWIEAAKSGDVASLELVLLRYYEPLLAHVRSNFSEADLRRHEAEDIVQQTHQRVFRSVDGFRGVTPEEFCSWLYRICNNILTDNRRAQNSAKRSGTRGRLSVHRSDESSMCILWNELRADASTPSKIAIGREEQEQLEHALRQLTEEEFELIRLRYFEDRSQHEIASFVGTSRSTVTRKCEATLDRIRHFVNELSSES